MFLFVLFFAKTLGFGVFNDQFALRGEKQKKNKNKTLDSEKKNTHTKKQRRKENSIATAREIMHH